MPASTAPKIHTTQTNPDMVVMNSAKKPANYDASEP